MATPRLAAGPPGDLLTVDPQSHLAVDAAVVVVVPLADALAQLFRGETAGAVRRGRREGRHLRGADGEDVAVGRKEVALLAGLLLILLGEGEVEHLDLDAASGQLARLQALQRLRRRPDEDA